MLDSLPWGLTRGGWGLDPKEAGRCLELPVTQSDPVNERPPVQEDSQSKECNAKDNPEPSCMGEKQDCEADHCRDDPECSHGAFSHSAYAVDMSVPLRWRPSTRSAA
jgi:hypothetical protein